MSDAPTAPVPYRVRATPATEALVAALEADHGPLVFHQSGGCCDGSAPMCYPAGDFRIGHRDVLLGRVAGVPFYMGERQYALWRHTALTIDVVPGRGAGFSLEAPLGKRFLTRSEILEVEELAWLDEHAPVHRGPLD